MKRDMDLIRALLLKLEDLGSAHAVQTFYPDDEAVAVEGYTPEQVEYHLALLWNAGFVDTGASNSSGILPGGDFSFRSLNWRGHELIDAIRDDDTWGKTKAAMKKAGSWTISSMLEVAVALAKQKLFEAAGLPTG